MSIGKRHFKLYNKITNHIKVTLNLVFPMVAMEAFGYSVCRLKFWGMGDGNPLRTHFARPCSLLHNGAAVLVQHNGWRPVLRWRFLRRVRSRQSLQQNHGAGNTVTKIPA